MAGSPLAASYVLPLRWDEDGDLDELTDYLRWLAATVDQVLVVDGSSPARFAEHGRWWGGLVEHLGPDPALRFRNGKVSGVLTGVSAARHEAVVVADDDVRYARPELETVVRHLEGAQLVLPQNYFSPLPWHARWDTARILVARASGGDFPGTMAVRRSVLMDVGGYDGDVLFENLELVRTVQAAGGRVLRDPACLVRRLPPDTPRFIGQRVRQAYDELARPARMAVSLAVLPSVVGLAARRRRWPLLAAAAAAVVTAEGGRRQAGGRRCFPASSSLLAPAWAMERAVCSWLAVGRRLTGGCPYAGARLVRAANPPRRLRRLRRPGRPGAPVAVDGRTGLRPTPPPRPGRGPGRRRRAAPPPRALAARSW